MVRLLLITMGVFLLLGTASKFSNSSTTTVNKEELLIQQRVDSLLSLMTLEEKIGQTNLLTSDRDVTGPSIRDNYEADIKSGSVGAIFNAYDVDFTQKLQKVAVQETRLGIPLIFGYDVVHGFKTIFPIPLAESCSWDLEAMGRTARIATEEASAAGLHWTFAPMIDVARDPRWGRIAETGGEDTYLNTLIAEAKVKGIQGDDIGAHNTILSCPKHFAAYGAAQAGRDYHTVDISERTLWETYLPPFEAAIDAGAETIMTSFNEIGGIPSTGNDYLIQDILKKQWGFDGFVVTDYTSINEMVKHGVSSDLKDAGELAMNSGVDMDMQGSVYQRFMKQSIEEGKVSEKQLNEAVRRILRLKFKLGLFDDPYLYCDKEQEAAVILSSENRAVAREMAAKSMVLLKNENNTLPLSKNRSKIGVVGPLAADNYHPLGNWHGAGKSEYVVSALDGIKNKLGNDVQVLYAKGCDFEKEIDDGFQQALNVARQAEVVIAFVGERENMSGEAASRSQIGLPAVQLELLKKLKQTGKPVVAVLMNGRPLTINWTNDNIHAILEAWFPGVECGNAIADVLFGDYNPSGKLTVSFPQNVGQIPLYYCMKNTGRPMNPNDKYTSKYLDVSNEPLYPFGYGLSYTQFDYSSISSNKTIMEMDDTLNLSLTISNTGEYDGIEIAQLYIRDIVGSVTRPVKELKGFQRTFIPKQSSQKITFSITAQDLAFYTRDMTFKAETGDFEIFIGPNATTNNSIRIQLIDSSLDNDHSSN